MVRQAGSNLTLIELGAGNASKTSILVEALLQRQLRVEFHPVDVSPSALQEAVASMNGHSGIYWSVLSWPTTQTNCRNCTPCVDASLPSLLVPPSETSNPTKPFRSFAGR